MDAAAKSVRALTRDAFPSTPYHLSHRPEKKYRLPPDHRRFEEWYTTDLQYLTFLSDVDRGVLLTRPEYDMREDPKPTAREPDAALKPGPDKKKMTLSDYKHKKTTGHRSASPPEPLLAKKKERDRGDGPVSAPAPPDKLAPDSKRLPPTPAVHGAHSRDVAAASPADQHGQQRPLEAPVDATNLPPKPSTVSLPPRSPVPDARKRLVDADFESRPTKRPKSDAKAPPPRDETPRRKHRESAPSAATRESKPTHSSSLLNGRGILKGAGPSGSSQSTPTSALPPRTSSVNGVRPSPTVVGSNRGPSSRHDTPSRATAVPPLLSPLNLDMDRSGHRSPSRDDKKKRGEAVEASTRPTKAAHPDAATSGKKHKAPMELPPILSPTLPPEIEAELERERKRRAIATAVPRRSKTDRDLAKGPRQPWPGTDEDEEDGNDDDGKMHRKRLIISLKIPKRIRQSVKRILALPPRREGQRDDRCNLSDTAPMAPSKPLPASSAAGGRPGTTPLKKARTSDPTTTTTTTSKAPAVATPSKKSAAMSRVSSTTSHTNTLGEPPRAAPPTMEQLAQSSYSSRLDRLDSSALKEKSDALSGVARRLKREADNHMKTYFDAVAAKAGVEPSSSKEANLKLGCLLTLESVMAFMVAFYVQDLHRAGLGKPADAEAWFSIFKFVESRRNEIKRYPSLFCILLLLRATADEHFLNGHSTYVNPDAKLSVQVLLQHQRYRARALAQLRSTNASIQDPALRLLVLPWATVDETADTCLRIMKRWSMDHDVEWHAEISLK